MAFESLLIQDLGCYDSFDSKVDDRTVRIVGMHLDCFVEGPHAISIIGYHHLGGFARGDRCGVAFGNGAPAGFFAFGDHQRAVASVGQYERMRAFCAFVDCSKVKYFCLKCCLSNGYWGLGGQQSGHHYSGQGQ